MANFGHGGSLSFESELGPGNTALGPQGMARTKTVSCGL